MMFIVLFFLPPGGLVLSRLRRQFLSTQLAVTFYDVVQVHRVTFKLGIFPKRDLHGNRKIENGVIH